MLSPLDDYPIHQVAEPVRRVGTSDRNFYDRYYFNAGSPDGDTFVILGFGQYPNLGVKDAFALVADQHHHRVVRASGPLGADRMDTTVGPFRIEVLEGLRRLRFVVEPTEHDVALDLTWEAAVPAHEEPRHLDRLGTGRAYLDACRLAQTGRWTGSFTVAGAVTEVAPERWWGTRDRSWGIRPSGEPEPAGITADLPFQGFRWLYAPMQFEDRSLFLIVQEGAEGRRIVDSAVEVRTDGATRHLGRGEYELDWDEDQRFVRTARLRLGEVEVGVEVLRPVHLGVGTGYGFDAEWRHGMWHGGEVVQGRGWDLRVEADRAAMWGIVDSWARFTLDDGQVGYGLLEWLFL